MRKLIVAALVLSWPSAAVDDSNATHRASVIGAKPLAHALPVESVFANGKLAGLGYCLALLETDRAYVF